MAKAPKAAVSETPHDAETGEIQETTNAGALATVSAVSGDGFITLAGGQTVRVKRQITVPVLRMKVDVDSGEDPAGIPTEMSIVARFVEPIREGKRIEGGAIDKAAKLLRVAALNGEVKELIVNTVLEKELDEAYPAAGYVGSWFHLTKYRKKAGKKYNTFAIIEIEDPRLDPADAG